MRAKDTERLGVLRMLWADVRKREIDERSELDDAGVMKSVSSLVKQRRDSVAAFDKGGRSDLAANELSEIAVLETYLPEPLSDEALAELVQKGIEASGADSMKQMGQVIRWVQEQAAGRADGKRISDAVKAKLS